MAFNGPPMEENLLARVRRWISYYAGAYFGPPNNIECPDAQRPEDIITNNPPLPNNGDDENGDSHGSFDRPNSRRGEEREEELNYDDRYVRGPSFPLQQFPPLTFGMDWRQQGGAVPIPVYYSQYHADPYDLPFVFPCAYPYALLNAFPYANPFAFAYVPPYAPPYVLPYPYAFAYVPPYAPPHASPYVPCYAAPPANPLAFLNVDPHGILEQLIARNQQERREQGPGLYVDGVDEEDELEDPKLEVFGLGFPETIGPLTTEEWFQLFNGNRSQDEEDAVVPSTTGFSSLTRRSRVESNEEETAAKKPRKSDERDLE